MTPGQFTVLADAVLGFHIVVIAFNVFGLIVIPLGAWRGWKFVRVLWWRALHLVILGVVALQALLDRICFLTLWEDRLLAAAGERTLQGPLIATWIHRIIFWPLPIWVFAVLYGAVWIYVLVLWWLVPPRVARRPKP